MYSRMLKYLGRLILPVLVAASGCGRSADAPLPGEDDLYAYALAVAEQVRSKVPPGRYLPIYHIGRVHERFGEKDVALEWYRNSLEADPSAPEPHRRIGYLLSQRKDQMDAAYEAYERSIRCDPDQDGVYTSMGMILLHQGKPDEAIDVLMREVRAGGASSFTHYQLGQAYLAKEEYEKALECYELASEMREALYGAYQALRALDREEAATAKLEEYREIKDSATAAEMEADRIKRETGDDDTEARRHVAATWEEAATVFAGEYEREVDPVRREEWVQETLRALHEALRFDENRASVYEFLIAHYRRNEMYGELEAVLRRGIRAFPGDPELKYHLALLRMDPERGSTVDSSSAAEEALGLLDDALRLAPENADAHLLAARVIFARMARGEKLQEALVHAQKALRFAENPTPSHFSVLAIGLMLTGDREEAIRKIQEGLALFPGDAGLTAQLGKYEKRDE